MDPSLVACMQPPVAARIPAGDLFHCQGIYGFWAGMGTAHRTCIPHQPSPLGVCWCSSRRFRGRRGRIERPKLAIPLASNCSPGLLSPRPSLLFSVPFSDAPSPSPLACPSVPISDASPPSSLPCHGLLPIQPVSASASLLVPRLLQGIEAKSRPRSPGDGPLNLPSSVVMHRPAQGVPSRHPACVCASVSSAF